MITLDLPIPHGLWLTANGRYHWRDRWRRTRNLRAMANIAARSKRIPTGLTHVHVEATIHGRTRRRVDPANAYPTIKALIDGLVDYGLIPDDDAEHLTGPDMRAGDPIPYLPAGAHQITLHITEETP